MIVFTTRYSTVKTAIALYRYTWGGYDQLELAKHYYSQAVKLAPSNLRALYGLLLTCSQLASSQKCSQV